MQKSSDEESAIEWPVPSEALTAEHPREWTNKYIEILQQLHEATSKPRYRSLRPENESLGWGEDSEFEAMNEMRCMGRLLAVEAATRAEVGDGEGAVESLESAFIVARHSGDDSEMVGYLMEIAIDRTALDTMDRLFSHHSLPADRLLSLLESRDDTERLRRVFLGDSSLPTFRSQLASVWERYNVWQLGDDLFAEDGVGPLFPVFLIGYRLELSELVAYNIAQVKKIRDPIGIMEWDDRLHDAIPQWAILSRAGATRFGAMYFTASEVQAKSRLAIVALRARKEREKSGEYPEKMETPMDPFSGAPIGYRREGTGFVVWSVGREGQSPIEWKWE